MIIPRHLGQIMQSKLKLKAVDYGGTDEYATIAHHADFDFERTDPFSVSLWVKISGLGQGYLVTKISRVTGADDIGYYLETYNGQFGFLITGGFIGPPNPAPPANWIYAFTTAAIWADDVWHHVCVAYDGSELATGILIYVDGVSVATTTEQHTPMTSCKNAVPLRFAARLGPPASNGSPEGPYTGRMSDVAVYDKQLSAAEVLELFNDHCPPRLEAVGPVANLKGFWRPSLTDAVPTITDLSAGAHNATLLNMEAADIYSR